MIKKLSRHKSSEDGYNWILHPTNEDLMEKINEIIDYLNDSQIEHICKYCKFASYDENTKLYKCFNTEICVEHSNYGTFGCNKWEEKL